MSKQRDISTLDLDQGASASIHTNVRIDDVIVAKVNVDIMVLEADDGHLSLMVDQNTEVVDDVHLVVPSYELRVGSAEDPG